MAKGEGRWERLHSTVERMVLDVGDLGEGVVCVVRDYTRGAGAVALDWYTEGAAVCRNGTYPTVEQAKRAAQAMWYAARFGENS